MTRIQARWSHLATVAVLVSALAGCSRCGRGPTKPAEEFIDKAASGVLVVPKLGSLADHAQALISSTRGGPGGETIVKTAANLAQQLGFDPLTKDGLKQAGLDPSRGIAASGLTKNEALIILPYDDLTKLDGTITRLLKDRANLTVRKTQTINNLSIVTYARAEGDKPLFAYTTKGENVVLGNSADPVALVTAAANRQAADSLVQVASYSTAKSKVGERDLYLYNVTPPASLPFAVPTSNLSGLSFAAKEIAFRTFLPQPEDRAKLISEVFVSADTGLDKMPPNLPVYARGAINWAKLFASIQDAVNQKNAKSAAATPPTDPAQQARDFFKKADIDLDTELLANLQPGFAMAVGIAPTASISTALNFNPARVDPFENYTLAIVAHVKDAAKAKVTLEKLGKLASNIGATITTKDVAGGPVYVVTYKRGEDVHEGMSWTLRGTDLILSGGYGEKLPELIKLVTGSGASLKQDQFPVRTREILFANQGLAFALDLKKVDDAVRGLQSDSGPGAEMMRSAFTTILSQVSAIRPAVGIAPTQGGVLIDAALSLQ